MTETDRIAFGLLIVVCCWLIMREIWETQDRVRSVQINLRATNEYMVRNDPVIQRRIRASQAAQETYERVMSAPETEEE